MALDPQWAELAERAARRVDADASGTSGGGLSVVLRIAGRLHGAIHVYTLGKSTPEAFARALVEAARDLELGTAQVNWKGKSRAPWDGTRAGACVIDLEPEEMPEALDPLHIGQTIGSAQSITERAVIAIGEELRHVYDLARSQAGGLERVAQQFSNTSDDPEHSNVVGTIEALTTRVHSFGQDVLDRTQRQARDIEQARLWTNDIVKLGQAIAAIASNARVLTFNARLESARIGEAGRGFAVIAGSIQELATQIRQTNDSVARLAENLAVTLPRLGADALQTSEAARSSVQQLEDQLRDVNNRLASAREESWNALNQSSSVAVELQTKANALITHLQFQDRAHQMLEQAREQTRTVLELAGLEEHQVEARIIDQVGELGRQVRSDRETQASGSVQLF